MTDAEDHDDLAAFHRYLCSLDYYADFKDKQDSLNENMELRDQAEKPSKTSEGEALPLTFDTPYDYINEWQSVFKIEARAQVIHSGLAEKMTADEFLLKTIESEDTFFIMTYRLKQAGGANYRMYDFVVVAKDNVRPSHAARNSSGDSHDRNSGLLQCRHS